jgi:hypothetical protein
LLGSPNRYPTTGGTTRFLVSEDVSTPPSSYTIITVFAYSTSTPTYGYIHRGASGDLTKEWGSARKEVRKISLRRTNGGSYCALTTTNDVLVAADDQIGLIVQTYSSGSLREALRVNGASAPLTDVYVSSPSFSVPGTTNHSFGYGFDAILSTIVYDRVLSADEIEKIEGYLYHHFQSDVDIAAYYDFPFPSTHPYYSYPPAFLDGAIEQPLSEVSSVAINGSFLGVIEQPLSEVSGFAKVYSLGYGVTSQPLSEIASFAINPLYASGVVEQELSILSGVANNSANPIFSYGIIEQTGDISGLAANGVVLGQVEQPLSEVVGFAVVPSVCFGVVRDYLSVAEGFAYAGIFIGTGVIDQPASSISGFAQTWIVGYGDTLNEVSDVSGIAINNAPLFAYGQIQQELSDVLGSMEVKTVAYGATVQDCDIQGYAVVPNVGFGSIIQEHSTLSGVIEQSIIWIDFSFSRCTYGIVPTIDASLPELISFDREYCGSFDTLSNAASFIPLSFIR